MNALITKPQPAHRSIARSLRISSAALPNGFLSAGAPSPELSWSRGRDKGALVMAQMDADKSRAFRQGRR